MLPALDPDTIQKLLRLPRSTRHAAQEAEAFWPWWNEGTFRQVFVLSESYVLKVAAYDEGRAQNRRECAASQDPACGWLIAKVIAKERWGLWSVQQRCRPIQADYANLRRLFKLRPWSYLHEYINPEHTRADLPRLKPTLEALRCLTDVYRCDPHELSDPTQWGQDLESGEPRLLDAGA